MRPLEFLKEEFENVQRALRETLRHDYSPAQSGEYYSECETRLAEIDQKISSIPDNDVAAIYTYLTQLTRVSAFVSLFERSRLGEFSWPFADELSRIAKLVLVERNLKGDLLQPIVHVVAEGQGYRIVYEPQVPVASSRRRFLVVAFPRSLKHHVLLHALFGHEVGHTALHTNVAGSILLREVLTALIASGPLSSFNAMNTWLNSADAHQDVKNELAVHLAKTKSQFSFTDKNRADWLKELLCDLVGILLFGPAFFAAHQAYLQPLHPSAHAIHMVLPSHPSFAIRHKMLVQIMRVTGWSIPITSAKDGVFHKAETEMLAPLSTDHHGPWSQVFDDGQIRSAVAGVQKMLPPNNLVNYKRLNSSDLVVLVERLTRGLPPILAKVDLDGKPRLASVHISQTLYAGWVYWAGRQHLVAMNNFTPLDFLKTNKLCDHALMQQRAIDLVLAAGVP